MTPLFRPSIRRSDMEIVLDRLANDTLSPSRLCRRFVTVAARRTGTKGGICLREYHRAVSIAFDLLGLQSGNRVAISPLAPAVYFEVMRTRALQPCFVDVESHSGLLNADTVRKAAGDNCSACVCDATLGRCINVRSLTASGLPIVEDISCALGSQIDDTPVGTFGTVTVVGLEAEHIITSGGGALVLTSDEATFEALQQIANQLPPETFLSEISGALAFSQLQQLSRFLTRRNEIGRRYLEALEQSNATALAPSEPGIYFSFPVRIDANASEIIKYAASHEITCQKAYTNSIARRHSIDVSVDNGMTNSADLLRRVVLFPLYPALSDDEEQKVCRVLATLP